MSAPPISDQHREVLATLRSTPILAGAAAFVLLSAGAFWWQWSRVAPGGAGPALATIRWGYLPLLLLAWPVETVASALRTWLLCRVLGPRVRFATCVEAEWANVAVSLLTPSQSGGGPGQMYLLTRAGLSVATALSVSLLSFAGTLAALLVLAGYSLWAAPAATGRVVASAAWTFVAVVAAIALGALAPDAIRRVLGAVSRGARHVIGRPGHLGDRAVAADRATAVVQRLDALTARAVDLAYAFRGHVARLVRHGKATAVAVVLLSVAFLAARAILPFLCARFLGVEGLALRPVLGAQAALIFLVFFAPTPGGAGIAEGASMALMADLVPPAYAPLYTLLWRFTTAYGAAIAGALCLARALVADARRLARRVPGSRLAA
jgi:uncharacterized membrane protein YbhN (UPF0104 family)